MIKLTSGKLALVFDDKQEIIRCLDIASEYEGTVCEVTPWDIVVVPADLAKICQKRGVRIARVLRVPTQEEREERPPEPLPDRVIETIKRMFEDAHDIPRHR